MSADESQREPGNGSRAYRLISALGQGGFGAVYRGELRGASGFTKQVAIKLLNEEASRVEDFKARLRDEARLLALLQHRAIVHVEDLVRIQGRWAVVMEYVDGADLKEFLSLGAMPPRPVCELAAEVASALQVAHEAVDPRSGRPLGIVHRDIKPANIRITPKGEVKVLDFGVARAAFDDREAQTRSMAFGSMGYLAPERFDGRDTPAADVYALGVVVLEALSGVALGQLSVNPRVHGAKVAERLEALASAMSGDFGISVTALLGRMVTYHHEERPAAAEVAERFQDLLLEAPGPWLKRWIPDVMARVRVAERAVHSGSVEPASASQLMRSDPGLVLSGGQLREPQSSDSIGRPAEPAEAAAGADSTRAAVREALRDSGGLPRAVEPERYRLTEVLDGLAHRPVVSTPPPDGGAVAATEPSLAEPAPTPNAPVMGARRPWRGLLWVAVVAVVAVGLALVTALGLVVALWPGEEPPPSLPVAAAPVSAPVPAAPSDPPPDPVSVPEPPLKVYAPPTAEQPRSPTPPSEAPRSTVAKPEPSPQPEPVAPAATPSQATGTMVVQGDVLGVRLVGVDGQVRRPGELPAGSYRVRVAFATGDIDLAMPIVVTSDHTTTLRCDAVAQACRVK